MKVANIDFEEVVLPLYTPQSQEKLDKISPSHKVPCLHHNGNVIWDSLSICEYINEIAPSANLLPKDINLRATARSVCCEMHSSFIALRSECSMSMKRKKYKAISVQAQENIDRIYEIWRYCKSLSKSQTYLFGDFTIADAFFAPIVSRIISYGIDQKEQADYINLVSTHKFYQEWCKAGICEADKIDEVDNS
jgi:glutathione S-transferase